MALLDVADYKLDPSDCGCSRHPEECGCDHCHECKEHSWQQWNIYPECETCLLDLSLWLADHTDYFELQRQCGRAA